MPSDKESIAAAAKEAGNSLLKEGKLSEAIKKYSEAIENNPSLHTYFGNRSAAYQKLAVQNGKSSLYSLALKDAESAISIKNDWYKGHYHKANSLLALGRAVDALQAAKTGASVCSGNKTMNDLVTILQEHAERVKKASFSDVLWGSVENKSRLKRVPCWFLIFLCILGYINPFGTAESTFTNYRRVLMLNMLDILWNLFTTHGKPQLNMYYAQRLMEDQTSQKLFFSAIGKPNVVALAAVVSVSMAKLFSFLAQLITAIVPKLGLMISSLHEASIVPLYNYPQWKQLNDVQKTWLVNNKISLFSAFAEVAYAFWLIFELFTPFRNFIGIMFAWQYLRIRYMISRETKDVFGMINHRLIAILTGWMNSYAQMPTEESMRAAASSSNGSMFTKMKEKVKESCTIM